MKLIQEAVKNDPTIEMITFLRDEMEMSPEHQLKLFQLKLGNAANSGIPPSSSMEARFYPSWNQGSAHHETGFYSTMQISLGAQQTTQARMSEGCYGNPCLCGNGILFALLSKANNCFLHVMIGMSFAFSTHLQGHLTSNPAFDEASWSAVKALVNESIANLTDNLNEVIESRLGAFATRFSAQNSSTMTNAVKSGMFGLVHLQEKGQSAAVRSRS